MTATPQLNFRLRGLLVGTLVLLAAQLGDSAHVQASCIGSEIELLWSFPEAGAEEVPTNLTIWAVTSVWGSTPAATLDGATVKLQSAPSFSGVYLEPQNLTPNSDHTLVLDYSRSPNIPRPGAQARFEIKFKTGEGPAEESVAAPSVTSSTREITSFAAHSCADVIAAQECFDTGQDALLSLQIEEASAETTLGWLLQASYLGSSAIWPARCGAPSVYLHSQGDLCLQVRRIGSGGRLSPAVEHCSEPTADMTAAAGHGGHASRDSHGGAADAGGSAHGRDASAGDNEAGRSEAADASAEAGSASARPKSSAGCSTVSGARTAARAFWAIVVIALLLAHSQRHQRRRPRGVTPSRRFRL